MSPAAVIAVMCAAHVASMTGFAAFPALLPVLQPEWSLTNTQAGWINGIYFAGYVGAVAVLVPWTDRVDSRGIYLAGLAISGTGLLGFALFAHDFWSALSWNALQGAGVGGTYMTGLKVLTDRLPAPVPSRGIAIYTAGFSVGTALSFALMGLLGAWLGWQWAFGLAAAGPAIAALVVIFLLQPRPPEPHERPRTHAFDFRPVLRNREAMAYVLGYTGHTWELFALRGWVVAFLVYAGERSSGSGVVEASLIAGAANLLAVVASITGNELCERYGRRRVILWVMAVSFVTAIATAASAMLSFGMVIAMVAIYGAVVMGDSGSLTAGAAGAALPGYRGMTLAIHSLFGFSGGFLGPLAVGLALDAAGGQASRAGWIAAFAVIGAGSLAGAVALWLLARRIRPVRTGDDLF